MIKSVLIANRGEIACRVMATAAKMGIRTIAVYSQADANARHVALADEAHLLGPAPVNESYLLGDKIIDIAQKSDAQAIHPGYGFLAENEDFANKCRKAGLIFIGPSAKAIRLMGIKDEAKALMEKAKVPVVPGVAGGETDMEKLVGQAKDIGFPIMLKAVSGGGGKGMRRVDDAKDFISAYEGAAREAKAAFGDDRVMLEKLIEQPRHIEVQVFGDQKGNVVHLFERDCSLQRRHQKVIEEAPAPGMAEGLRARMCEAAVNAAKAVDYEGAGTVEFLVPGGEALNDDTPFYFMEMNTRLQVEHPVTEKVTGFDLVAWQFKVASGEALPAKQEDIRLRGHAMETRIYAEDPANEFLPAIGHLHGLDFPENEYIRIDTGVREGDDVSPFYDPMIAKIIAYGSDRDTARKRLDDAICQTLIAGPKTNSAFLHKLLVHEDVARGKVDTGLIARDMAALIRNDHQNHMILQGALALLARKRRMAQEQCAGGADAPSPNPWNNDDGFQIGLPPRHLDSVITALGEDYEIRFIWQNEAVEAVFLDDALGQDEKDGELIGENWRSQIVETLDAIIICVGPYQAEVKFPEIDIDQLASGEGGGMIKAPMSGKLIKLFVSEGDEVEAGDQVAIVEAMKMEHVLTASLAGTVSKLNAAEGTQVDEGAMIVLIEAPEDSAES